MNFKLLVEETIEEYNKFENIETTPLNIMEKHKVPVLHKSTINYTTNSKIFNNKLWDDKRHGDLSETTMERTRNIHNNLDTAKKASQDLVVYTGVRRDPQELVKESGGLLHHAAFISTSADPNVALRFTKPTDIQHVIKIKIRKGQQVGGYLGDDSEHKSEKEFLIKSNQVLHFKPEPKDYKNSEGKTIRVHEATILNKKELDKESEHPEIQSKLDFDERLDDN